MFEKRKILPLDAEDELTDIERTAAERSYRRRAWLNRGIGTVALLGLLYNGAYETPVLFEQMSLASTKPKLKHIANMPKGADLETIVIGGWGFRDSSPIAAALPQLSRIGGVEALEEDNKGIDPSVIAQEVIQQAEKEHVKRVGFWGDSVGGIIATKVARIIQESDSPVSVDYIVLDCTPTNTESLRPDNRGYIPWLQLASGIFPNIAEHPLVDYLSTQYVMQNRETPTNGSHLGVNAVINGMNNPEIPSSSLLSAEALEVVNPQMSQNFKAMSEVKKKAPPLIFTIRPLSNTGDAVVISSVAEEEETHLAKKYDLQVTNIKLSGISHGDPAMNQVQYHKALNEIIIPIITDVNDGRALSKKPIDRRITIEN